MTGLLNLGGGIFTIAACLPLWRNATSPVTLSAQPVCFLDSRHLNNQFNLVIQLLMRDLTHPSGLFRTSAARIQEDQK